MPKVKKMAVEGFVYVAPDEKRPPRNHGAGFSAVRRK